VLFNIHILLLNDDFCFVEVIVVSFEVEELELVLSLGVVVEQVVTLFVFGFGRTWAECDTVVIITLNIIFIVR